MGTEPRNYSNGVPAEDKFARTVVTSRPGDLARFKRSASMFGEVCRGVPCALIDVSSPFGFELIMSDQTGYVHA
jgi:hypothetical protein